jgi:hypothetical protein
MSRTTEQEREHKRRQCGAEGRSACHGHCYDFTDIDLAILLKPRDEGMTRRQFDELEDRRAVESGRQFRNPLEKVLFPRQEVRRFLKVRNPYISLHDFEELERLRVESMVLFSRGERHWAMSGQ